MGQERDCFLELKRSRLYLTLLNLVLGVLGASVAAPAYVRAEPNSSWSVVARAL